MQAKMFDLTGRVALVTGGTRGIGRSACEVLAAMGAKVVVSSRKADACEAVVEAITAAGGEAAPFACNVSSDEQMAELVAFTMKEYGQIDALVANAASNPYYGPLLDIDDRAYDKIMGANLKSVLRLSGLVIPGMAERGGGSVIFTSSIGGLKGSRALGAYAISKAGLMQLARNLAMEWGRQNVRVNTVAPGLVKTDFAKALWDNPEAYQRAVNAYPLGRLGEPDDIGGVIGFLACDASRFITGQTLVADGGVTIAGGDYS